MQPTGDWLNQPGGLAERLLSLRKAAGLKGDQLAAALGWARSKVSKLENGRQMPKASDLTAWAQACGQPGAAAELLDMLAEAESVHRQYRHRLRVGHAAIQAELDQLVRAAKRIRCFEVTVIPGLLQTPGYARARMLEAVRVHGFAEDQVEAAVAARMRRQDVLYEPGRQFEFVITEAALRILLCPPGEMLGQLDRLLTVEGLGHVSLGVIPFGTVLPVAPMHGFMLLDDVAYAESHSADREMTGPEAETYRVIGDGLAAEAVTGEAARALISDAAATLRGR